ncbi:TolB family protein [Balneola sp. MJW-20]|uniref:TolB family protein n=1 Tax=Gracilimonas aurantiaca TaxID=3234185 RepID=UPI003467C1F6
MNLKSLTLFVALIILFTSCQNRQVSPLHLLNEQIPGDSAIIFGEGIISTDAFEFAITFSPEMNEILFTRRKPGEDNIIYHMKLTDGAWSTPTPAFFTTDEGWDFEPHINPRGNRLYFGSLRPLPNSSKSNGLHQWYSEITESDWGEPVPINGPFLENIAMYLTSAENGNLYYTSWIREEGEIKEEGIYHSIYEEETYNSRNKMGKEINLPGLKSIAHPYIAPDESYIIFDGKSDSSGHGSCDLYISFNKKGKWTKAQNLGPLVNTELCEFTASVSPDGRYLFFHRGLVSEEEEMGNIYWIDFSLIKQRVLSQIK